MNAKSERIFGLDVLRSLAILSVLLMHTIYVPGDKSNFLKFLFLPGWIGVDLFFVLSGFLIGNQIYKTESWNLGEVRQFWMRRWTRTLPLYFFVLFVYLIIKPFIFGAPFQGDAWKFFFFLQNFFPIRDFAQSWSLCIEEQFYLFIPVLFFLPRKLHSKMWILFIFLSPVMRGIWSLKKGYPIFSLEQMGVEEFDFQFRFITYFHLDGLMFGMFLSSTNFWKKWDRNIRLICAFFGTLIVIVCAASFGYAPKSVLAISVYFSLLGLGFALMLVGLKDLKAPSIIGLNKAVYFVAITSYGAYLWNTLFIRVFSHYSLPGGWAINALAFISLTFLLSWVTYIFIEQPGMKLRLLFLKK